MEATLSYVTEGQCYFIQVFTPCQEKYQKYLSQAELQNLLLSNEIATDFTALKENPKSLKEMKKLQEVRENL